MKSGFGLYAIFVLLILALAAPVYAGGIGMFVSGGSAEADWDGDYLSFDADGQHRDIGFAVDSNLATDKLFNYRLELGRAEWEIEDYNNQGFEADVDGLVMTHNFGFGGKLAEPFRLWFGPEVRLTLLDGEVDGIVARDIDLFGYGFGGAIGANFNFPGRLTVSAKSGFVMMRYLGDGPNWDGSGWRNSDLDLDEDLAYLSLSMFFRTRSNR